MVCYSLICTLIKTPLKYFRFTTYIFVLIILSYFFCTYDEKVLNNKLFISYLKQTSLWFLCFLEFIDKVLLITTPDSSIQPLKDILHIVTDIIVKYLE